MDLEIDNNRLTLLFYLMILILIISGCSNIKNDTVNGETTYNVSGRVVDENGKGIEDVVLTFTNASGTAITDANGKWSKTALKGQGIITLSKANINFFPSSQLINGAQSDIYFTGLNDVPAVSGESKIVFLHINDSHGKIDNFAKMSKIINDTEIAYGKENVFVLSAGDMFSGDPLVDQYDVISGDDDKKGYPMIDLMNDIGIDLMVIGNHEFDYGQDILDLRIEQANFPLICANFDTSRAILEQPEAFKVLGSENGEKIAVLGLIQLDENGIPATHPDKIRGISFFDGIEEADKYKGLAESSHVFAVLSHLGNADDKELAGKLTGCDLIIGGHSHTVITNPYEVNGSLIVQAGDDGAYIGKVVITLRDGEIIDKTAELIDLNEVTGVDSSVQSKIDGYIAEKEVAFSSVLAEVVNPINGKDELGSLMTDAITKYHNLDFAFQNNGGIRLDSIDTEITMGDVYELDPFGNQVIEFEMTTDEIESLIKYSFEKRSSIDLQVSGLKYTVLINDIGAVVGVELKDYQGELLDDSKLYTVGLNSYIASSYEFDHQDEGRSLYITSADTLIEYLKTVDKLDYDIVEPRTGIRTVEGGEGTTIAHTEVDLTTENKMLQSTTAGNLMADAVKEITGVDIGTYTSENLGNAFIAAGPIYEELLASIYTSFAYSNNIDQVTATGMDIEKMILSQSKYYGGAAVQISGMTYRVIQDDEGNINRVECYIGGERISQDTEYTIGLNSYYSQYYKQAADNIIFSSITEETEEEILKEYLMGLEGEGKSVSSSVQEFRIETIVEE